MTVKKIKDLPEKQIKILSIENHIEVLQKLVAKLKAEFKAEQ